MLVLCDEGESLVVTTPDQLQQDANQLYKQLEQVIGRFQGVLGLAQQTTDGRDRLTTLVPDAIFAEICSFLCLPDVQALKQCNQRLARVLDASSSSMVARQIYTRFYSMWQLSACTSLHAAFLGRRLACERHELAHWEGLSTLYKELLSMSNQDIFDVVANIGRFPSMDIARAVTSRRAAGLSTIVTRNQNSVWRLRTQACHVQFSFIIAPPLNSPIMNVGVAEVERPEIQATGFVGYAVDLLQVRNQEEEHLRNTVLVWYVYRDLTVWETRQDLTRAQEQGLYRGHFHCTLDINDALNEHQRGVHGVSACWNPETFRPSFAWFQSQGGQRALERHIQSLRLRITSLEAALVNFIV